MWFQRRTIDTRRLGRMGERRAAWYYLLRGYRVVARNVRLRSGEIDLIVRRGSTLVIAEVKTRQSRSAGEGYEAVQTEKRMRLVRLADEYLSNAPRPLQLRYDILSLYWNGCRFEVSHYADAFRPTADRDRPWLWRA